MFKFPNYIKLLVSWVIIQILIIIFALTFNFYPKPVCNVMKYICWILIIIIIIIIRRYDQSIIKKSKSVKQKPISDVLVSVFIIEIFFIDYLPAF